MGFLFVFGAEIFGSFEFFDILDNNMQPLPDDVFRGGYCLGTGKKNEEKFGIIKAFAYLCINGMK